MGSFRSLATTAILLGVGYFLFTKINESPSRVGPDADDQWQQEMPQGIPPLEASTPTGQPTGSFEASGSSVAPQWSDSTPEPPSPAPPAMTDNMPGAAAASTTAQGVASAAAASPSATLPPMPAIPEMPDMPEMATGSSTTPPSEPSVAAPTSLPANIPTARYSEAPSTPAEGISGRVPSLGTATSDLAATGQTPQAIPSATLPATLPATPPATPPGMPATVDNNPGDPSQQSGLVAVDPASLPPATAAAASAMPPASPPAGAQAAPQDDRYATIPSSDVEPVGVSSFAAGWPVIQAALERGELARAHLLLSQWYEDPSLTPSESQQVETLLSQLAGTVVYSTEHRLEPAHVVQPGETLESIAQQCKVPWQLLAKINGIPAADQVRPGQQLKVVQGPFSAVVELGKSQLTLMLEGRYAGSFPITVDPSAAASEGEWVVDQKLASPDSMGQASVDRLLVLRGQSPTGGEAKLTIAGASSPTSTPLAAPAAIRVSPRDAAELTDILSVGSTVVIRR